MTSQDSSSETERTLSVLVVDDEVPFAGVVADYLKREGMAVALAHDGPQAVEQARHIQPDLVVLDIMLPGFDGVEVCRKLRTFTDAYVIMLTARDTEMDKVVALSVGADDYIVKPFSPRELVARAKAMLRRPRTGPGETFAADIEAIRVGELVLDSGARTVTVTGREIELTRTEFDILATMAARPGDAFTRHQILLAVWGENWYGDEHVIDVHVGHIRTKLGDESWIRTVRGVGYGLRDKSA